MPVYFPAAARDVLRLPEAANLAPVAVNQSLPGTVLAHQHIVVLPLDAGNAHHVAWVIQLECRQIEHVVADFAHIPNQVRHEPIARI